MESPLVLHFRFKECAGAHPLNEIASAVEYEELSKPEPTPVVVGEDDDAPPAADPPLVEKTDAEKVDKYIASRGVLYKSSKERVEKVKEFESQIKRPYFHIKALDDVQLNTWHKYLDFVEKEGDLANVSTPQLYSLDQCATLSSLPLPPPSILWGWCVG